MRRTLRACLLSLFLLLGVGLPPAPAQILIAPKRQAEEEKPTGPGHVMAVPYAVGLLSVIGVLVVVCMPSRKHT
ncbi:MAG TPA: hypothetical protein VFA18_07845 [Gemmataceae bacterium]|nr:hypothetical protein [Gemmataceae bacterium]